MGVEGDPADVLADPVNDEQIELVEGQPRRTRLSSTFSCDRIISGGNPTISAVW